MAEPGRANEWRDLERAARARLADPLAGDERFADPRMRAAVELHTWRFPSGHDHRSWSLVRSHSGRTGERRLFVRRATWRMPQDHRRFAAPLEGLREGFHAEPTVQVTDGELDDAPWQDRIAELQPIALDSLAWPAREITLDGVAHGLRLTGRLEMRWSNDAPAGWQELIAWVDGLREWMERALPD